MRDDVALLMSEKSAPLFFACVHVEDEIRFEIDVTSLDTLATLSATVQDRRLVKASRETLDQAK